jgi:hypothetical protein
MAPRGASMGKEKQAEARDSNSWTREQESKRERAREGSFQNHSAENTRASTGNLAVHEA